MSKKIIGLFLIFTTSAFTQNIKSIQLRSLQKNSYSAIAPLGTVLELSFDDLDADSKDYAYKIEQMTHDWQKSKLFSSQYINGFDENNINNVTNSFNTFQNYTHYSVRIPNSSTKISKSGNYLVSILNDNDETVFTRRFVLYENATTVGVNVSRSRNANTLNKEQTIEFTVNHPNIKINSPSQEINIVILKNENWNEQISDLQPTFFKQNQLKYSYINKTNFLGGNEYLYFDSKSIRNKSLNIVKIEMNDIFHHYLYPYTYNKNVTYRYNPDINGHFVIRTLDAEEQNTEADYAMTHFTLLSENPFINKDVYIYGAFNNFELNDDTKMHYNSESKSYQAQILLKQGFYNYTYVTKGENKKLNTTEIVGSFYETENEYKVLVYYKPFGGLHERVIGVGYGYFNQNK